jgi:hypothetical protein
MTLCCTTCVSALFWAPTICYVVLYVHLCGSLQQGFLYLEVTPREAAGTWVDMSTILSRNYSTTYSDTYYTQAGANHIQSRPNPFGRKTPDPVCNA